MEEQSKKLDSAASDEAVPAVENGQSASPSTNNSGASVNQQPAKPLTYTEQQRLKKKKQNLTFGIIIGVLTLVLVAVALILPGSKIKSILGERTLTQVYPTAYDTQLEYVQTYGTVLDSSTLDSNEIMPNISFSTNYYQFENDTMPAIVVTNNNTIYFTGKIHITQSDGAKSVLNVACMSTNKNLIFQARSQSNIESAQMDGSFFTISIPVPDCQFRLQSEISTNPNNYNYVYDLYVGAKEQTTDNLYSVGKYIYIQHVLGNEVDVNAELYFCDENGKSPADSKYWILCDFSNKQMVLYEGNTKTYTQVGTMQMP